MNNLSLPELSEVLQLEIDAHKTALFDAGRKRNRCRRTVVELKTDAFAQVEPEGQCEQRIGRSLRPSNHFHCHDRLTTFLRSERLHRRTASTFRFGLAENRPITVCLGNRGRSTGKRLNGDCFFLRKGSRLADGYCCQCGGDRPRANCSHVRVPFVAGGLSDRRSDNMINFLKKRDNILFQKKMGDL